MEFDFGRRDVGYAWVICPKGIQPLVGQELDAGVFGKVRVVAAEQKEQFITGVGGDVISTCFLQPMLRISFLFGPEIA